MKTLVHLDGSPALKSDVINELARSLGKTAVLTVVGYVAARLLRVGIERILEKQYDLH